MNYPIDIVYRAAMQLLPANMDSINARAMLTAIGLQESQFQCRHQIGGPAHGFWQFEEGGGVRGVLTHPATQPIVLPILRQLRYGDSPAVVYAAIEHNDILACVFARLNLWWLPQALPGPEQAEEGWRQYLDAWRPGRPHPESWPSYYAIAWQTV
jgi:hypothetical protein